jgi:SAM-dependent methyltransferase
VNIAQKLRKLVDPDIIASTREHLHRALHPLDARELHRELESERWDALRKRYPRGRAAINRYADTSFWIKRNVERAQDLSLQRPPRRHILDLGCGPGYFLYIAHKLGHTGLGLDTDERPIFRDIFELFNLRRIIHRIQPLRKLPAPEQKFDLITSYLTCFHRIERLPDRNWRTWSPEEWQFFIDDVRANQLSEGGTMLLEFHPQKNGELYSRKVRELFLKNGARLFRSKVFLR